MAFRFFREWHSGGFLRLRNVAADSADADARPVPLLRREPLRDPVATVVAFYLPQFHPIPENDAWWGRGFTEWANTTRAVPQFAGHYQPRLPGELGFYDLRVPEVQRRQVELAKLYGIGGFCFHFYWFGGKRLLELPLLNYLADKSLDVPFCLCWANENWTRRWDGKEKDVLIGQNHSPADDIAFISYIARYLRDPRYIRVGNKPLVVVYRPNLLPSMRDTARRWRRWCRENKVGKIFIACTQSFETVDPKKYGLDAAIEFPPNNSAPPQVRRGVKLLNTNYQGIIYDWRVFPKRSRRYDTPRYPLFRGVNPAWDNEPRRPGRGTTFIGSSAEGYLEWLENAVVDAIARAKEPSERIVFVNAWNEWAEGAYLEPDQRHGYAYLEATRMALVRAGLRMRQGSVAAGKRLLAVVVHAYYPNIFREMLACVDALDVDFKLFVTTPEPKSRAIRALLRDKKYPYEVIEVENRGRDMAPFLAVMQTIRREGFAFVLKLHTKRSPHRKDGHVWRREIYRNLALGQMHWMLAELSRHPEFGLVGPAGHVISMKTFWGSNQRHVRWLASRMGAAINPDTDLFPAGGMFLAHTAALEPLLNLAITLDDFEPEAGQMDGTLAHAIERAFSYSTRAAGLEIAVVEPPRSAGEKSELRVAKAPKSYRYAKA